MRFLRDNGYEDILDYRKETISLDVDGIVDSILYNIPEGEKKKYSILVSDTHDNKLYINALIQIANKVGIRHVIHCGDIVSEESLESFSALKGKFHVVYGNHDMLFTHKYKLNRVSEHHNFSHGDTHVVLNHMNKKIIVTHGHNTSILMSIIEEGDFDLLFLGHYHMRMLYWNRNSNKYMINPGCFTNNKLMIEKQDNLPSFVLFPIEPNNPADIIFYQIPKKIPKI